ncbi:MAG: metal-sulfur cluster assembly factor, partial [Actinomycetota bacterium]
GADAAAGGPDAAPISLGEDSAKEALKAVVDPELGINIVDLGLVYEITIDAGAVHVQYTLTTMGCPIGPLIEAQMQEALAKLEGFESLTPELMFRPPWTPEMMSDEAKAALGYF